MMLTRNQDDGVTLHSITVKELKRLQLAEETLLALEWADQWNASRDFCNCDVCPFSTWDGCNRECQSAYAHRNEWIKAYKERNNA